MGLNLVVFLSVCPDLTLTMYNTHDVKSYIHHNMQDKCFTTKLTLGNVVQMDEITQRKVATELNRAAKRQKAQENDKQTARAGSYYPKNMTKKHGVQSGSVILLSQKYRGQFDHYAVAKCGFLVGHDYLVCDHDCTPGDHDCIGVMITIVVSGLIHPEGG